MLHIPITDLDLPFPFVIRAQSRNYIHASGQTRLHYTTRNALGAFLSGAGVQHIVEVIGHWLGLMTMQARIVSAPIRVTSNSFSVVFRAEEVRRGGE